MPLASRRNLDEDTTSATCSSPNDTTGYANIVETELDITSTFTVTVECATELGYVVGTAAVAPCAEPGPYTLSGCAKFAFSDSTLGATVAACKAESADFACPGVEAAYGPLAHWDVSAVTNMAGMFQNAGAFNGDLSAWDVSAVTAMRYMFYRAGAFNGDLSAWDVSAVTKMGTMFYNANAFNGDLSAWDVSAVTDMGSMFHSANAFNGDLSAWDVSAVTNMGYMFGNANAFNGDLSTWDVSAVTTDMQDIFLGSGLAALRRCPSWAPCGCYSGVAGPLSCDATACGGAACDDGAPNAEPVWRATDACVAGTTECASSTCVGQGAACADDGTATRADGDVPRLACEEAAVGHYLLGVAAEPSSWEAVACPDSNNQNDGKLTHTLGHLS
jgi:surface protein